MNIQATVLYQEVENSLPALLARLEGHYEKALSIRYDGRVVQAGYHITEVKAAGLKASKTGVTSSPRKPLPDELITA